MRTLWTPRWLLVHACAVILVLAFLGLGYWQVNRAADGNLLSFGYAIEWPVFAAFVIFVWIKEMRRALSQEPAAPVGQAPPEKAKVRTRPARTGAAYDDSDDEELAAYNHYLAWRGAHPHAPRSEYPGWLMTQSTEKQ